MVPNILFFGSRILTPQYFWLIVFVIALIVVALLLAKKIEIGRVVFELISINQQRGLENRPGIKSSKFC